MTVAQSGDDGCHGRRRTHVAEDCSVINCRECACVYVRYRTQGQVFFTSTPPGQRATRRSRLPLQRPSTLGNCIPTWPYRAPSTQTLSPLRCASRPEPHRGHRQRSRRCHYQPPPPPLPLPAAARGVSRCPSYHHSQSFPRRVVHVRATTTPKASHPRRHRPARPSPRCHYLRRRLASTTDRRWISLLYPCARPRSGSIWRIANAICRMLQPCRRRSPRGDK